MGRAIASTANILFFVRQFKFEVHQCLVFLDRILQMAFYSQAIFSVFC